MKKTVALVGTLDTKGEEYFIRKKIASTKRFGSSNSPYRCL